MTTSYSFTSSLCHWPVEVKWSVLPKLTEPKEGPNSKQCLRTQGELIFSAWDWMTWPSMGGYQIGLRVDLVRWSVNESTCRNLDSTHRVSSFAHCWSFQAFVFLRSFCCVWVWWCVMSDCLVFQQRIPCLFGHRTLFMSLYTTEHSLSRICSMFSA